MLVLVEQKLKIDLFYYHVNYVSYLFRLSDAIMDCSACYIKPFLLDRSHLLVVLLVLVLVLVLVLLFLFLFSLIYSLQAF